MGQFGNLVSISSAFLIKNIDWEIQRSFDFQIWIYDLPGGIEAENTLTFSLESGFTPNLSNTAIEMAYGNSKVKVAGQAELADGDITVRDFINRDTEYILYLWQQKVYDPETDKLGYAHEYKKEGHICLLTPDGNYQRVWNLKGVWPSSISYGDLSYDGGDKRTMTMTLSYDRAIREYGQQSVNVTAMTV